jgi:membrane protease subunit (stomatin/prohibitin family)
MGQKEFDKEFEKRYGFKQSDFNKCKECGGEIVTCPHCMKDFCPECEQP